ncbi:MAG: hypothetical protein R2912_11365 [Eubacteriales bacterium]
MDRPLPFADRRNARPDGWWFLLLNAVIFRAGAYSVSLWTTAAFITALPGILIQLAIIPALVLALKKAKLITE